MTLTLILSRHAKSDWSHPGLPDFDRPLNDRGRRSAKAVGEWLARRGYQPGQVIVSGARRTVETWDGMAPAFDDPPKMEIETTLYDAGAEAMLRVLQGATQPVVMMIGHNPGIGAFANRIVDAPDRHPRFADYPTCATLLASFPGETWRAVSWGTGRVMDFVVPRDL